MQHNIYTKVALGALFICLQAGAVFAQHPDVKNNVTRAVAAAALQRAEAAYEVAVSLDWKKEVTLGDLMLRAPRRPARKEDVVYVKQKNTRCRGVLVENGTRVLMPAACLEERKYQLERIVLHFANGRQAVKNTQELQVNGDIVWAQVPAQLTAGLPSVAAATAPQGKRLQDIYGAEMSSHLRSFFHMKNVGPLSRTRPGAGRSRLRVGDAVIYQGKVVALVKEVVGAYGTTFGGVSEKAFAIIR